MDKETREGRRHRRDEGLEQGRKMQAQRRVRERAYIKPITPPGEQRTDPERGTGEHGIESLDPGVPLTEEPEQATPDDVGQGQSNR